MFSISMWKCLGLLICDSDGFVLNVGVEEWQKDRVVDCFKAAGGLPEENKFKLFFSFDMTCVPLSFGLCLLLMR